MEKLKELALLLDDISTQIYSRGVTLNDVNLTLQYLNDDFSYIEHKDMTPAHLIEFQRTVRIIARLMNYTIEEMNGNIKQLEINSREIFETVKAKK